MKEKIHPEYHSKAKAHCVCGAEYVIGSTKPKIEVEICANCHPFYTGKKKLIDTAGRVEKFKARANKAATAPRKAKKTRVKPLGNTRDKKIK